MCCAPGPSADREPERYEYTQIQMGMPFRIALYARDEASANRAAAAAYARIRELNGILSDYVDDSELMRLCRSAGRGEPLPVSRELLTVLLRAQELSRRSEGAFDVSVGPLVRLWRAARRSKTMPGDQQLAVARGLVGYTNIRIDETAQRVELLRVGMQLDCGGIGAGYAVDEAHKVLEHHDITSALIDASGDIGVSGAPPGKPGWRIGIAPLEPDAEPSRYLLLANAAVTTSGDAYQFVEIGGQRYSHIVDPRTGLGLTERTSVTLVARDCTTADSYTKAVCVLGPKRGLKLIEETAGAAVLIVRVREGQIEQFESPRLHDYLSPESRAPAGN